MIVWAVSTLAGVLLMALIVGPYMADLAATAAVATPPPTPAETDRAAHIVAQSAFFAAVGMLLSAFVAAVAARLGGLRAEEMHAKGRN